MENNHYMNKTASNSKKNSLVFDVKNKAITICCRINTTQWA